MLVCLQPFGFTRAQETVEAVELLTTRTATAKATTIRFFKIDSQIRKGVRLSSKEMSAIRRENA